MQVARLLPLRWSRTSPPRSPLRLSTSRAACALVAVLILAGSAHATCPPDDIFEPNDTQNTATPLGAGSTYNARVCTGNDDHFALDVVAGERIEVRIAFEHALGDLDAQLLDPVGAQVAGSASVSNQELLNHTALVSGVYSARVYGFQSAQNGYTIRFEDDTDEDGLSNGFEVTHGFNQFAADENANGVIDGQDDTDADGLGNAAEQAAGTDPNDSDSDGDSLLDGEEIGTGLFEAEQEITTAATGARSVYAADLDGDGDLDVLSASNGDDTIAWYANLDGAGTFGPKQEVTSLAAGAMSVFAADLDGDGDVDVLSASWDDSTVAWYENTNGAGAFGAKQAITTTALGASSVFAADVDGDGDLDVLSASASDATIAWYENIDGAGSFGAAQAITTAASGATSVFAGDFDGDGDVDVVSASVFDDTVAWYENLDGAGTFGVDQEITTTADGARGVHAADVDGDGDLDVLSASQGDNTIAWYENSDGLGMFVTRPALSTTVTYAQSVFSGDVDGDGDIDVLSASYADDTIAWYENLDGSGTFGVGRGITATADGARSVFAADVDGDGDLDVLSASEVDDTIAWYEQINVSNPIAADSDNDGLGDAFELAHGFDPFDADENANGIVDGQDDADADGLGNAAEEAAGTDPHDSDSDDDGLLDGEELGTGVFGAKSVITAMADSATTVIAADVDGDGDLDVLSASWNDDTIAWYENTDGSGTFGAERVISSTADGAESVFAADLDGDGDLDVLSASSTDGTIAWYENSDGAGTFGVQQVITTTANGAIAVVAADLDGDGDLDVLSASNLDDTVAWYENSDGAGTFGVPRVLTAAADGAISIFAADVDGDGANDVLSASSVDDTIAWYENSDGFGTFVAKPSISATADGARSVFSADLDGDGDLDVLSASWSDDTIAWYENTDGGGTFGIKRVITTMADNAFSVFAADVDGDGDLDVLSASRNDDTIAWYENADGSGAFGAQRVITTTADAAESVFAADLDGDGDVDVLSASWNDDTIAWYEQLNVSDPLDPDSDDDGLLDGFEVAHGFDPLVAGEQLLDSDSDGLDNAAEQAAGTDPHDSDSDDDGLLDGDEVPSEVFGAKSVISSTAYAVTVSAADLDGDGDADVISADNNRVEWYENTDGAGTFGAPRYVSTVGSPTVFAADMDGDGDLDVLLAGLNDDTISWYPNLNGTGVLGTERVITTSAVGTNSIFAADVDGDGDLDVLSASRIDHTVDWYENLDGAGNFGAKLVITETAYEASSVFAADVDGDGDIDVLSASYLDDTVAWYENIDVLGRFWEKRVITTTADGALSVFAADMDGDGDVDVLSASMRDSTVAWYENTDGSGTFGTKNEIWTHVAWANSVIAVDVGRDGDLDVVACGYNDDTVAWYENNGMGTFGTEQVITNSADSPGSLFAADLDGDGDLDVLSTSTNDTTIAWYEQLNPTDPLDPDSDDDGLLDGFEATHGFNPLNADENANGILDGQDDTDADGLDNATEQAAGTDPQNSDSDDDGLLDGFEVAHGFDPLVAGEQNLDPDADGLSNLAEQSAGTNPHDSDTDADTIPDGLELSTGRDALVANWQVHAGFDHACALDDQGLQCWGNDGAGQATVPPLVNPVTASAGRFHSCALDDQGARCWGANVYDYGQTTVPALVNPVAVSVGWLHSCALDDQGARCWGHNVYGQTNEPPLVNPVALNAGGYHSCALDDGGVKCWGLNGNGQSAVPALVNPVAVSAGGYHSCAIDDAGVQCWGADEAGQKTNVPTLVNPVSVTAGRLHSCALDDNGVQCWGSDANGQSTVPALVNPVAISAGYIFTCALDDNGVQCWGDNAQGQKDPPALAFDKDLDGLLDAFERAYGFDPLVAGEQTGDPDSDALDNLAEQSNGTNPLVDDTDGDGLRDGFEVVHGFDPLATGEQSQDPDLDGLDNLAEQSAGTDPNAADSDGDGTSDGDEVAAGLDPLDPWSFPVDLALSTVGDAGNAGDTTGFGAVPYEYSIGTFEVTNREYLAFLNAIADDDPNGLFNPTSDPLYGIVRTGAAGSYQYAPAVGAENLPVNFVSVYDAMRFVNWLENGQPIGAQDATTTEDGAYTITPAGVSANDIELNAGATHSLPSEGEWYKAAYYDSGTQTYFESPAGAAQPIGCGLPGATPDTANCDLAVGSPTDVGAYSGSPSPNGAFDLGGNVWEWTDEIAGSSRRLRGGAHDSSSTSLEASGSGQPALSTDEDSDLGMRIVPEPGLGLGLFCALAGLWAIARRRESEKHL